MSRVFTNMDQFNKHFFPKDYKEECLKKMSIEELLKYQSHLWASQIMKKIKRILRRKEK